MPHTIPQTHSSFYPHRVSGACLGLSKTLTFPRTLRRAEYQNLAALFIFTVKLFFSGPRIRIIAEDNANAEGAVTYRCNTQVLKQYCLFRAETQWFFLSNDSLSYTYEKIRVYPHSDLSSNNLNKKFCRDNFRSESFYLH